MIRVKPEQSHLCSRIVKLILFAAPLCASSAAVPTTFTESRRLRSPKEPVYNSVVHPSPDVHGDGDVGVISGFDDVLRQAELPNLFASARRLFQPDAGFAGMPALFRAIAPESQAVFIISGITSLYESPATRFLNAEGYPKFELRFRNWISDWPIAAFKLKVIKATLRQHPRQKYIFIFDNSAPSLEIAKELRSFQAAQVAAIYLRQTVRSPAVAGATYFITTLEIALAEFSAKRLSEEKTLAVMASLLAEPDADKVIPSYAYCPPAYQPCETVALPKALRKMCALSSAKVAMLCRRRLPSTSASGPASTSGPRLLPQRVPSTT